MLRLSRIVGLLIVVVLLLSPLSQAQSAPFAAPNDSVFGVNSHLATRYPNHLTLDEPLKVLDRTGAGFVREEFQLSLVDYHNDGEYNWGFLDKVILHQASQGMTIVGLLNDAPGKGPPNINRFVQFATAAASRYKDQVHYWEIWNEPENPLYWNPPDPAGYVRLLQAVTPAIRSVNPHAKILMAGIVPTHTDFLRGVGDNGGWSYFDIIALHPYVDPWTPESGQIGVGGDVSKMQTIIEQYGNKPIWATEFGWSTGPSDRIVTGSPVDEETQANFLVRGAALLRIAGIDRVIWYNFKDTATRNLYGMIRFDTDGLDYSQHKPILSAFTTLNKQLGSAKPVEALQVGNTNVIIDFEQPMSWKPGQGKATLVHTNAQARSGSNSGEMRFTFASPDNDFEGFYPPQDIPIPGTPRQLGIWVYGNGGGNELKVWLRDAENEILQFRLGVIGTGGWRFVSTPITQQVEGWNRIGGSGNMRLDYPIALNAFIFDDNPNTEMSSGVFYMDDFTAMGDSYGVRFDKGRPGGERTDVLWAIQGEQVRIPTHSSSATLVDRAGNSQTINANNGELVVNLGPAPVYLTHVPAPHRPGSTPPQPTPTPLPTPDHMEPATGGTTPVHAGEECFDATGQCMSGRIREYWHQNGGLAVFGYPITPQRTEVIEGKRLEVQWFERNRLELHPQNARPYDVLLGRLSEELLYQNGRVWQEEPKSAPMQGCRYFSETGFNVCGRIYDAWRANGLELDGRSGKTEDENMALFGLPLGDAAMETIQGKQYLVQWFERARFEVHPENPPPHDVLLGLLGNETLLGEN